MKKDHQSNNVTRRMGINHILCDHFHYYILEMLGYRCRTQEEDDDGKDGQRITEPPKRKGYRL